MHTKLTATILFIILQSNNSFASLKPNKITKDGYCIVNTKKQRTIGLNRFKSKQEFKSDCNGKMIFLFKKNKCRLFTMKKMNFDIFIEDNKGKSDFKTDERKLVCGKKIIETLK